MTVPAISLQKVSFSYNAQAVLEHASLSLPDGDFTSIMGPNGGGKTTLLRLILGLLQPGEGAIRVWGLAPRQASPQIGYVPQNVHTNRSFPIDVLDVVAMGTLKAGRGRYRISARARQEALRALNQVNMADWAGRRIGELSGGQRQRVFIARALVAQPQMLLLDEPTDGIDGQGREALYRLLHDLNRTMTILVVSHDLMAISAHVKSVLCVNRQVYYHGQAEITADMVKTMYPSGLENTCPVELVAHGLPHRVLKSHRGVEQGLEEQRTESAKGIGHSA